MKTLAVAYVLDTTVARLALGRRRLAYAAVIVWVGISTATMLYGRYSRPSRFVAHTVRQFQHFL